VVPRVLRFLAEKLGLEGEYVVEHPVDPPAFQPVVGDDPRVFQLVAEGGAELTVDPRLAPHLGLLEKLQAAIERQLLEPVRGVVHLVPSTSTRPAAVTRARTLLSGGSA
jgi:hypothetical protein